MNMGVLIGVLNAIVASFQNSRFKKLESVHAHVLNWFRLCAAVIIIGIIITLFFDWQFPPIRFWIIMIGIILPTELANSFLYVRAFQISPQSLVGPLFVCTSIFLIPLGYIVLGEVPTAVGILGVLLIVIGALFLGFSKGEYSLKKSIAKIFQERGSVYMVSGAAIVSISIISAKFLFQYTSPLQYVFYLDVLLIFVYTPLALKYVTTIQKGMLRDMTFMSASYTASSILHFVGLSLLFAAYYISIKRLSVLFDVLSGRFIHKEEHFYERFFGALIMVGGVVLIILS